MEIITINIEKDNLADLDLKESLYLKLINSENKKDNSPDFNELEKFDCIPHFKKANNTLKEIENNLIIDHKNRDNYKKLTSPLYLKTETYINFLKSNNSKWDLVKFLFSPSFKTK
jgi:hypothetical protein